MGWKDSTVVEKDIPTTVADALDAAIKVISQVMGGYQSGMKEIAAAREAMYKCRFARRVVEKAMNIRDGRKV